ncbi:MAG: PD-(D/E)XK nuclease family protein, partial [Limisphaerales bacterium]
MITLPEPPVATRSNTPTTADRVSELGKTISASRLGLWLGCRLKFYFRYLLQIKKPTTPAMHSGSTVHSVLQ